MNISEEFNKMYNGFMDDSDLSYETKDLLTSCYHSIERSLKVFGMVSKYPDLHRQVATYTYDSDGILISEEVNNDKDAKVMEYYKPVFDRGRDAMVVILHIFKEDNGTMIFANPPFVNLGTISKTAYWINDRVYDVLDDEDNIFCDEIKNKIRDKMNKLKSEVRANKNKD